MFNVEIKPGNKSIAINVNVSNGSRLSASGKTKVVATTSGNQSVVVDGKVYYVGLNVFTKD